MKGKNPRIMFTKKRGQWLENMAAEQGLIALA